MGLSGIRQRLLKLRPIEDPITLPAGRDRDPGIPVSALLGRDDTGNRR